MCLDKEKFGGLYSSSGEVFDTVCTHKKIRVGKWKETNESEDIMRCKAMCNHLPQAVLCEVNRKLFSPI